MPDLMLDRILSCAMPKFKVTWIVRSVLSGTIDTIKNMCSDAKREISQLEHALIATVESNIRKLLNIDFYNQDPADISDSHRVSYERLSFEGFRNLRKCLADIQTGFEDIQIAGTHIIIRCEMLRTYFYCH